METKVETTLVANWGKNTKYFHASCNKRRRNNHIQKLLNENDEWTNWQNGLQSLIQDYFQNLFTAEQTNGDTVLNCITQTVSEHQNRLLLETITEAEVKAAVFSMHPDKAPGPDGMTPAFFQKNCNVVGKEVVVMIKKFFETGVLLENINATNIVLIPKKEILRDCQNLDP